MVEQQKPVTPSRAERLLEDKSEEVTLPSENEMLARLHSITNPEHHEDLEKNFFPKLTRFAGSTVLASSVVSIIVEAINGYIRVEGTVLRPRGNLRHSMAEYVPSFIDIMIDDPQQRKKAREFIASAVNG